MHSLLQFSKSCLTQTYLGSSCSDLHCVMSGHLVVFQKIFVHTGLHLYGSFVQLVLNVQIQTV